MSLDPLRLRWLDRYREYGAVWIRLIVGYRLVHGTADNVFSQARMLEFAEFLQANGFPLPMLSAYVSAYAQFVCGILFILGALTRPAALVMLVNFAVALAMVHLGLPFAQNFEALMMLCAAAFLLLHGAGALSVDRWSATRAGSPGR